MPVYNRGKCACCDTCKAVKIVSCTSRVQVQATCTFGGTFYNTFYKTSPTQEAPTAVFEAEDGTKFELWEPLQIISSPSAMGIPHVQLAMYIPRQTFTLPDKVCNRTWTFAGEVLGNLEGGQELPSEGTYTVTYVIEGDVLSMWKG